MSTSISPAPWIMLFLVLLTHRGDSDDRRRNYSISIRLILFPLFSDISELIDWNKYKSKQNKKKNDNTGKICEDIAVHTYYIISGDGLMFVSKIYEIYIYFMLSFSSIYVYEGQIYDISLIDVFEKRNGRRRERWQGLVYQEFDQKTSEEDLLRNIWRILLFRIW